MRITIFSLGGLLGQYVTNTALLHGAQVTAYVPDAKVDLAEKKSDRD